MKNQLSHILSILTIAACFLPLFIVAIKNLWKIRPLVLVAAYWCLSGIVNLTDKIPGIDRNTTEIITVLYNTFDIPIVLWILFLTTKSPSVRRFTSLATPVFLGIQLLNLWIQGLHYDSAKYMLALGLVLVLTTLGWEISRYLEKLEHTLLEKSMVFLHASFLFAYGTFIIIYVFDYYIKLGTTTENFLIYYISSLIAILIALAGYFYAPRKAGFANK